MASLLPPLKNVEKFLADILGFTHEQYNTYTVPCSLILPFLVY